jgi:hypothetical protein
LQDILQNKNINFILGDFLDAETLFLLRSLIKKSGNIKVTQMKTISSFKNIDFRNLYL